MKHFYATTPIYYVNDRPHIGHAYCTILADVFCKYQKLWGKNTYFLTGTDEHGQKVMESSKKRGVSPKEHVDEYHLHFKEMCNKIDVNNDDFIRTTDERHIKVVKKSLQDLYDKGEIYEKEYEGWYSISAEKFWTKKDLIDGKCPDTGNKVVRLKEKNYFFKMSKYQKDLIKHIEDNPEMISPESRKNEVRSFLNQPLEDLCISRPKSRLSWGIELPFDKDFVTYVWFDALLNYVSALDKDQYDKFWTNSHHFLGKDILITHCVYWTTMLMALKKPLPKKFIVTGWWLKNKEKMSKSLGNVVDPLELVSSYGIDPIRYFLIREMPLGQDCSYDEDIILERNNKELANDFGNLIGRVTLLASKNFKNSVPPLNELTNEDKVIWKASEELVTKVKESIDNFNTKQATESIMAHARLLNKYITDEAPYKILRSNPNRAATILHVALESLRLCCSLLYPVMPQTISKVLEKIGIKELEPEHLKLGFLKEGMAINGISGIFPKYETKVKEIKDIKEENSDIINFDDFCKVKLKVGKVLEAEKLPKSKKLLKVMVDVGEKKPRQILGGIAEWYEANSLVGKNVVVVCNLKPRKMMGIESQGMMLAASSKKDLCLVDIPQDLAPGSEVS